MSAHGIRSLICSFAIVALSGDPRPAAAAHDAWIATWAASMSAAEPDPDEPLLKIDDQTVRQRVRVSVGGARVCIRLSNEFGTAPVVVGAATLAEPAGVANVKAASIRAVTFGGRSSVTIAAGAPALSDPVDFPVAAGAEISISLYFPKRIARPTLHALALKRAVVSRRGDHTRAEKIEGGAESESWFLVSAVLVPADASGRLVVALGDSITDGAGSSPETDQSWPAQLARRLAKTPAGAGVAVVNAGMGGNRLLRDGPFAEFGASALARFDRDALGQPGVTHVVLLEGVNDIGMPGAIRDGRRLADSAEAPSADDLIDGYSQLIARARVRGVKMIGATIPPFAGMKRPGYYSDSKEATRQTLNKWIRTGGAFDAVIDFDAVLRDPERPLQLLPRFASEDHFHPNDEGYRAVVEAVDLAIFK
jgi:lysophospholipase L1-like esterase